MLNQTVTRNRTQAFKSLLFMWNVYFSLGSKQICFQKNFVSNSFRSILRVTNLDDHALWKIKWFSLPLISDQEFEKTK